MMKLVAANIPWVIDEAGGVDEAYVMLLGEQGRAYAGDRDAIELFAGLVEVSFSGNRRCGLQEIAEGIYRVSAERYGGMGRPYMLPVWMDGKHVVATIVVPDGLTVDDMTEYIQNIAMDAIDRCLGLGDLIKISFVETVEDEDDGEDYGGPE